MSSTNGSFALGFTAVSGPRADGRGGEGPVSGWSAASVSAVGNRTWAWLQYDFGDGPTIPGRKTRCSAHGWRGRDFGW